MEPEQVVKSALRAFGFGDVQVYKNLAVMPVFNTQNIANVNYLTLEDALKERVLEVKETGRVNDLELKNKADTEVLVVKGEYLIGGKQNRMITVNALLDHNAKSIVLPVHCVQQGRWSAPGTFDVQMRRVSTAPSSLRTEVRRCLSGSGGQAHTWAGVEELLNSTGTKSGSADCNAIFEGKKEDIGDVVKKFNYVKDRQVGCVVAVKNGNETQYFMDVFDKARTMEKHYERLLTSYVVDALRTKTEDVELTKDQAKNIISLMVGADASTTPSLSLGKDVELTSNKEKNVYAGALVFNEVMIYLGGKVENKREESKDNKGNGPAIDPCPTMIFRDNGFSTGTPFVRRSSLYRRS